MNKHSHHIIELKLTSSTVIVLGTCAPLGRFAEALASVTKPLPNFNSNKNVSIPLVVTIAATSPGFELFFYNTKTGRNVLALPAY